MRLDYQKGEIVFTGARRKFIQQDHRANTVEGSWIMRGSFVKRVIVCYDHHSVVHQVPFARRHQTGDIQVVLFVSGRRYPDKPNEIHRRCRCQCGCGELLDLQGLEQEITPWSAISLMIRINVSGWTSLPVRPQRCQLGLHR